MFHWSLECSRRVVAHFAFDRDEHLEKVTLSALEAFTLRRGPRFKVIGAFMAIPSTAGLSVDNC